MRDSIYFLQIGQGTYSSVYKARDLTRNKLVALKRVRFDNMDSESVTFMAREILILRRLDHPNVIKLEGLVASRTSSSLYLVLEYMEHDLTGLASLPGVRFSEPQVFELLFSCNLDGLIFHFGLNCKGTHHSSLKSWFHFIYLFIHIVQCWPCCQPVVTSLSLLLSVG